MTSKFAIVDKESGQIRTDSKNKNALIFESRPTASRYLRRVKSLRDKHSSEIVEVTVEIRRVR